MYSIAVLAHETAHYIAAKKLFYRCTEIQLGIFGAVLYGDFDDVRGSDRIRIALAGPVCNMALCVACCAIWWIFPQAYAFTEVFFTANCTMAAVNLLPCYPLDGGRVLTGLLENKIDEKTALSLVKKSTVVFAVGIFTLFVISLFTETKLFGLGLFAVGLASGMFTQSRRAYKQMAYMPDKKRTLGKGVEKKTLVFTQNSTLGDVARRMRGNYLYALEVVNDDLVIVRKLGIAQLERVILSAPLSTVLRDLP